MAASYSHTEELDSWMIVAAINFGSTYSGYAFAFRKSPTEIRLNKKWLSDLGNATHKTPNCVLTGSGGAFEAFGYEARQRYCSLYDDERDKYSLFDNFKLSPCGKEKITLQTTLTSKDGKKRPAIDIFSMALKYLKDHFFNCLKMITDSLDRCPHENLVRWIIIIPAFWQEDAKHFIRAAAQQAGLCHYRDSANVQLCLNTEAAAIYYRRVSDVNGETLPHKEGLQYLTVHCGGERTDITAHEVLTDGKVKEICEARGKDLGSTRINDAFISLMKQIFGTDFIEVLKDEMLHSVLELEGSFEKSKRLFNGDSKMNLLLPLPYSLELLCQKIKNHSTEEDISHCHIPGISFRSGNLVLKNDAAKTLFEPTVNDILAMVKEQMNMPQLTSLSHVILAGGLCGSAYMQQRLKEIIGKNVTLLISDEAEVAELKGAIVFGSEPTFITVRIARYTYGVRCSEIFDPSKHDPRRRVSALGEFWCPNIFKPMVIKGEEIAPRYKQKQTIRKLLQQSNETKLSISIFAMNRSELAPVEYTDNPEMMPICTASVNVADFKEEKEVIFHISLGSVEMEITAEGASSGKFVEAVMDI